MTNPLYDAFKDRLRQVLAEVDRAPEFPLKDYLTKESFKKIVDELLNNHPDAENLKPFEAKRNLKDEHDKSDRTHHITLDEEGNFYAILDTKGKKPKEGEKVNRQIAQGAKKRAKPSFRIDVWPPKRYVSAVSYGAEDVQLAKDEIKTRQKLNTPFHQPLLISEEYPHKNKAVAISIFSEERETLNSRLRDLEYISRYVISYGMIYAARFMHEKEGLVYGDFSPANVFVSEHRKKILRPYLNDFGTTTTPGKHANATPNYESPELFAYLIQMKEFQKKINLTSPDSLSRGYARKRRNKADGEFEVKGEPLGTTYKRDPAESTAALENDVWSLGVLLYQIHNKGLLPTFDEFTKKAHDPFFDGLLTEKRATRQNITAVMNSFFQFMKRNHEKNQGVLYEILDELMILSDDLYYQSELVRDIYVNLGPDPIKYLIKKGLNLNAVLQTSLTHDNHAVLKAICELELHLTDFAEDCVKVTSPLQKAFLFKHIVQESWAVKYILDNIFGKSEDVQKQHLYLLFQLGFPMEVLCSSYLYYDYSPVEKTTNYLDRLKVLFSMVKILKPSTSAPSVAPLLQIDFDYTKPILIAMTKHKKSPQFFAHTIKALITLGINEMSILRFIGLRAKNPREMLDFAIKAGVDLKPLFIEASTMMDQDLYRNAILAMLEAGYGKTDQDFVTEYVTNALRKFIATSSNVEEAQSRLTKYGAAYEDSWEWKDTTGKLFTSYLLSFDLILKYENEVNSRISIFPEYTLLRNYTKMDRLKSALTLVQFILGANTVDLVVKKLEEVYKQYHALHTKNQGFLSKWWNFQSNLVTNLQQAVKLTKEIRDNKLTPKTLGTTTPLADPKATIKVVTSLPVKGGPKTSIPLI